jgi:hypothetical protein
MADAPSAARRPGTFASIAALVVSIAGLALVVWLVLGPIGGNVAAVLGGLVLLCVFALVIRPGATSTDPTASRTRAAILGSRQGQAVFPALLALAVAVPWFTGEAMWAPLVGMVAGLLVVAAAHSVTLLSGR